MTNKIDFSNMEHINLILNFVAISLLIITIILFFYRIRKLELSVASLRSILVHRTTYFKDMTQALRDFCSTSPATQKRFQDLHDKFENENPYPVKSQTRDEGS